MNRAADRIRLSYFLKKEAKEKKESYLILEDMEDICPPNSILNRYRKAYFIKRE